jgi:hypothetical protein
MVVDHKNCLGGLTDFSGKGNEFTGLFLSVGEQIATQLLIVGIMAIRTFTTKRPSATEDTLGH